MSLLPDQNYQKSTQQSPPMDMVLLLRADTSHSQQPEALASLPVCFDTRLGQPRPILAYKRTKLEESLARCGENAGSRAHTRRDVKAAFLWQ
jgi:hypothetical protein